ncbi:MAG: HEAT repeat domain-containing protein [Crenarchaeota archaeon]|nr:MAG: HEAT repeat domain-containing protein [Thermoproteota archaeon]RDJ33189.1 MAG: HEAT repeat domain-containing protein [Thermoproteota archaeon]RDJ36308.1 MAG: HEAT repeat domain-containing protein [Thermoproteota archaeon]RDJ38937.1 MAG: HEAT repeat domain-containing protein [Thermoproteota archaeon]
MVNNAEITKILDSDSKDLKIQTLESLSEAKDPEIIRKIITKLDDPDIQVRGEAFSALVLNENDISEFLIQSLDSESRYVRGFSALILANRNEKNCIESIIKLTEDQSSMVRECALGALGFLKAEKAKDVIHRCFFDSSIEVKKSALKAAIDIGETVHKEEIDKISKEKDAELEKLIVLAQKKS